MNFYSASVALLWATVLSAVTSPAGARRGISYGAHAGYKMPATPERNRTPCRTRSKPKVLP
jgi:hypothetical protein